MPDTSKNENQLIYIFVRLISLDSDFKNNFQIINFFLYEHYEDVTFSTE